MTSAIRCLQNACMHLNLTASTMGLTCWRVCWVCHSALVPAMSHSSFGSTKCIPIHLTDPWLATLLYVLITCQAPGLQARKQAGAKRMLLNEVRYAARDVLATCLHALQSPRLKVRPAFFAPSRTLPSCTANRVHRRTPKRHEAACERNMGH